MNKTKPSQTVSSDSTTTDFGYQRVSLKEKAEKVAKIFSSVAGKYDLMNDLMSLGVHRLWKRITITQAALRPRQRVLDLAGGTGDLSSQFVKHVGEKGEVVLADINFEMLQQGRDRLINHGVIKGINYIQADAEELPFPDDYFNCVTIAFGLRNVTNKDKALENMLRILKPGGRAIILEFSKLTLPLFQKLYDAYSFSFLPFLGKVIAQDEASYRYLAESIRMFPDQETLLAMMQQAGFKLCNYVNLNGGIVALHRGYKS